MSGSDRFSMAITMVGRADVAGRGSIADLGNGSYAATYSVPMAGAYDVAVTHKDLGSEAPTHIRGSPFRIACTSAWTVPRVLGAVPPKRKAAALLPIGGEVVLWGGDSGGPYALNTSGADWKWSPIALPDSAAEPPARTAFGAALAGKAAVVVFAGIALADQSELGDVWQLRSDNGAWSWGRAPKSLPFVRELKRQRALALNQLPNPRPVPATGMHVELTPGGGTPFWLEGHKWKAGTKHTVQLSNVDTSLVSCVKFYLNVDPKADGAEPVYVANSAPFVMGIEAGGAAKAWDFEAGELTITAVAEPIAEVEGGETVVVRDSALVIAAGGIEVRCWWSARLCLCSFLLPGAVRGLLRYMRFRHDCFSFVTLRFKSQQARCRS
jgi:hypothetical protein